MSQLHEREAVKRIKRPHDHISRKRRLNKRKRETGQEYVGFSVQNDKMRQDTIRMERKMGPPCTSPFCKKSKLRHCEKFNEDTRTAIFQSFWQELDLWGSKQIFVQSLVKKVPMKNSRSQNVTRKQPFQYFLYLNGDKIQVISTEKRFRWVV